MNNELRTRFISGIKDGSIVPYLGPGVLGDVRSVSGDRPMPVTSDQLIIAMNGGNQR